MSGSSARIQRNIAALLGPILAKLLRKLSFAGNPDPLGCFRLVLRNTQFRKACFGEADLLSELGSDSGFSGYIALAIRDCWRNLICDGDSARARATLALAVGSFKTRGETIDFFSDIVPITRNSQVLVGKEDQRGRLRFRRHNERRKGRGHGGEGKGHRGQGVKSKRQKRG